MNEDNLLYIITYLATTDKIFTDLRGLEWSLYQNIPHTQYFQSTLGMMINEHYIYYDPNQGCWTLNPRYSEETSV